jgi:DNA (cytosine-5)-methyltransferase 1
MKRPPILRASFGQDDDDFLDVDLFAGGGGASVGIERALGKSPDIAINHDKQAISMHRANHPGTKHYIENVWRVDPRKVTKGKRIRLMWLSPDCKHFSKAKGGAPHRSKKVRSLANVAIYWAKALKARKPQVIVLENVEEFQTWGPLIPKLDERGRPERDEGGEQIMVPCPARKGVLFRRFVNQLRKVGYDVDWQEMVAADFGAPTSRKRLFLIARSDGKPIVWPEATHGPGRAQPWRTAAECIDWAVPCPSIFERQKPLAENTQRRIARGIDKFVKKDPFIVPVTHTGDSRVHGIGEPVRTITGAKRGELALVAPVISSFYGVKGKESRATSADQPLRTQTADPRHALVAAHITKFRTGSVGQQLDLPLSTVTAGSYVARPAGAGHAMGLVSAFLKPRYGERPGQDPRSLSIERPMPTVVPTANGGDLVATFLAKHNAGHEATGQKLVRPVDAVTSRDSKALVASSLVKLKGTCKDGQRLTQPLATVQAGGNHYAEVRAFLMKYHRDGGQHGNLKLPMPTVVCNDSLALVEVAGEPYAIVDIGMRMLQPRELYRAHDFPDSYVIERGADGEAMTKEAQVRMVGNSVCPPMAEALVRAQFGLDAAAQRREVA